MLQCVAVCCSVWQSKAAVAAEVLAWRMGVCCNMLLCVAVWCSVSQCVAAWRNVLQCAWQYVAVCVAVFRRIGHEFIHEFVT